MNYEERIKQCDKDMAAIQAAIQKEKDKLLRKKDRFNVYGLAVVKTNSNNFMFGLRWPYEDECASKGYLVRRGFDKSEVREIIKNLREMIGD